MKELFIDELHDMLSAEHQIVKALPGMVTAAQSPELKTAFRNHLKETKGQVTRLDKIFRLLKIKEKAKFCKATYGLIQECKDAIKDFSKSPVRDAALISKAQRIEHYEISAYGTLRTFAYELKLNEIGKLLQETLNQEANADKKLTKIAEGGLITSGINHLANQLEQKTTTKKKTTAKKVAKKRATTKTTAKKTASKRANKSTTSHAKKSKSISTGSRKAKKKTASHAKISKSVSNHSKKARTPVHPKAAIFHVKKQRSFGRHF